MLQPRKCYQAGEVQRLIGITNGKGLSMPLIWDSDRKQMVRMARYAHDRASAVLNDYDAILHGPTKTDQAADVLKACDFLEWLENEMRRVGIEFRPFGMEK
jgi:hypothetical protein